MYKAVIWEVGHLFVIGCIGKLDMDVCVLCGMSPVHSGLIIHTSQQIDGWMNGWMDQLVDWWIQVVVVVWHVLKS